MSNIFSKIWHFWSAGSMPKVNIPKWSLSIRVSEISKKFLKKLIFKDFFRTRKFEKSVFVDQRSRVKFSKKSRKFANRPVEVGQVADTTPNKFFWLKSVCAIKNESCTSLARPFMKKLCSGEVGEFSADFPEIAFWSICECLWKWDTSFKKFRFLKKSFFRKLILWEMFFMFLALRKKSFWSWK